MKDFTLDNRSEAREKLRPEDLPFPEHGSEISPAPGADRGTFAYGFVMFIWTLYLFEPARMIAHYVPALFPLRWLPSATLILALVFLFRAPLKKADFWFAAFVGVVALGTVVAFFDGNWGRAREVLRELVQFFILGTATLTFVNTEKRIRRLFLLYFWYLLYYAVWGLVSLKLDPIAEYTEPGIRAIVPWHPSLDNRDGFGSLMVIGMAFSFYLVQAVRSRKTQLLAIVSLTLCLAGIVQSFGRGVFLAMVGTTAFIWMRMEKKMIGAVAIISLVLLVSAAAVLISPGDLYWEKMKTIESGGSEGTGAGRIVLWGWAWREFLDSPVFGVGAGNYGIYLPRLIPEEELIAEGYTVGRIWGRALHCVPLTILSEYGIIGVVVFCFLLADFIRINRTTGKFLRARQAAAGAGQDPEPDRFRNALTYLPVNGAMMACFIAYWINGIFYEIFYVSFFWHILILNRLLYTYRSSLVPGPAEFVSRTGDR